MQEFVLQSRLYIPKYFGEKNFNMLVMSQTVNCGSIYLLAQLGQYPKFVHDHTVSCRRKTNTVGPVLIA